MIDVQPRSVDPDAMDYLLACLTQGRALARAVLPVVRSRPAVFATWLPADYRQTPLDFSRGGVLPQAHTEVVSIAGGHAVRTPDTSSTLAAHISGFLGEDVLRLCCFEDPAAKPADPIVSRRLSLGVRTTRRDVFYLRFHHDASLHAVVSTLRAASSPIGFVAVLSNGTPTLLERLKNSTEMLETDLEAIGQHTQEVIVPAFDGESYLVWKAVEVGESRRA